MFEKNMQTTLLLDFYGEALDSHTKDIMKAYYEDDLSLSEIAADENISRQGVRHIIKRGEDQLIFLEERLGLMKRNMELSEVRELLYSIESSLSVSSTDFTEEIKKIKRAISILS